MDEETFTKIAKADFTFKIIGGFVLGTLTAIAGIIGAIILFVNKKAEVATLLIVLAIVGALVGGIDGYLLFRRSSKKEIKNKDEQSK